MPPPPQTIHTQQATARKLAEQEQLKLSSRLAAAQQLARTISLAGYRMTQAQFKAGHRKPYIDAEGALHWPVLLVYAENMQQDVIEDFDVTADFAAHLDEVCCGFHVMSTWQRTWSKARITWTR